MAKQVITITLTQQSSGDAIGIRWLYTTDGVVVRDQRIRLKNPDLETFGTDVYAQLKASSRETMLAWLLEVPLF